MGVMTLYLGVYRATVRHFGSKERLAIKSVCTVGSLVPAC
jgi:hypothetical protein